MRRRIPIRPGPPSDWAPGRVSCQYKEHYDHMVWDGNKAHGCGVDDMHEPCALCGSGMVRHALSGIWNCTNPDCANRDREPDPYDEEDGL